MPRITVSGSIDPLLSVVLDKGESIFAERNAMVSMDSTLALTGRAKGGLFSALSRKVLNDESFFQQKIEAVDDRVRFFSLRRCRATLPCYRRGSAST